MISKRVIVESIAILLIAGGIASSQVIFPGGEPGATALTGSEVVLGNQNGTTVDITLNQIKTFVGTGGGGSGCSNCVLTFDGRPGPAVTLQSSDVTNALGFAPLLSSNNLSDLTNVTTARTNLGLGTSALTSTGTSGATVGLLNTNNTYSGTSNFTGTTSSSRHTYNTNTTLSSLTDNYVCGDVSGGAITLTMPPNTIVNGTTIGIKDCKRQAATHTLTIAGNSGQTIDGSATVSITTNGQALLLVWNSTDNDWNLY